MGLTSDIEKVFLETMGNPEDVGNIPQLAEGLADVIIDFLTKQTFTITKMKAVLEVEEMSTTGPVQGDVLPTVTIVNGFGPGNVVNGKQGVLMPKVNYKKFGGQGGALNTIGHAYIGRNPVDNEETNEDLTKVKLLDENIIGR